MGINNFISYDSVFWHSIAYFNINAWMTHSRSIAWKTHLSLLSHIVQRVQSINCYNRISCDFSILILCYTVYHHPLSYLQYVFIQKVETMKRATSENVQHKILVGATTLPTFWKRVVTSWEIKPCKRTRKFYCKQQRPRIHVFKKCISCIFRPFKSCRETRAHFV